MASSIQRGRGQLPTPITDSGAIAGAGAGEGSEAGITTSTIGWVTGAGRRPSCPPPPIAAAASVVTAPLAAGAAKAPLQMRKLAPAPCCSVETSALPVMRHQAGRSSRTEISELFTSSSSPGASGSMC